jgi:RHS repeat-associated protein
MTNALGHSTFHEYDLQGRETYTWGPATYPVVQGYDTYGQRNLLRTFRDTNADFNSPSFPLNAIGDTTTWTYDDATGALLQKTYADGKGPSYTYYADGLLKTRIWARKDTNNNPLTTTYTYTPQGQLAFIDYSDLTPDVTYTYNTLGQQATITDGTGTRNFAYDPTTQTLTQEVYTGTLNATLNRAYDDYTRPTGYALVDPTGAAITTAATYAYDTDGNFHQVQGDTIPSQFESSFANANTANLTSYTFTYNRVANSDLISTVTGPVHTVTNTYEPNRDILTTKQNRVTTGPNANSIISQYDYTVNPLGQRTTRTQSGTAFDGIGYAPGTQLPATMTGTPGSGTATDTFTYNPRGEVINSINNIQSSLARSYTYDPIGNRLNATEGDLNNQSTNPNAKIYTSNSLNQYTQINTTVPAPPTTAQPTYDDDGNMLTDGTGKTYTWDCENRLVQVNLQSGEIAKYYYDTNSRRSKGEHFTVANTRTTTYLYDDWNVIHEKTTNTTSTETAPAAFSKTYTWGLDLSNTPQGVGGVGGLLHSKSTIGATHQHYLYDANGNITDLLTPIGTFTAHYEYDPFGNTLPTTGPDAQNNPCRFSTKPYDLITELHYYGYRFYDSRNGRWITRDPIEEIGFENLYCFVENNATRRVEYNGLVSCDASWTYDRTEFNFNSGTFTTMGLTRIVWLWDQKRDNVLCYFKGKVSCPCTCSDDGKYELTRNEIFSIRIFGDFPSPLIIYDLKPPGKGKILIPSEIMKLFMAEKNNHLSKILKRMRELCIKGADSNLPKTVEIEEKQIVCRHQAQQNEKK